MPIAPPAGCVQYIVYMHKVYYQCGQCVHVSKMTCTYCLLTDDAFAVGMHLAGSCGINSKRINADDTDGDSGNEMLSTKQVDIRNNNGDGENSIMLVVLMLIMPHAASLPEAMQVICLKRVAASINSPEKLV